MLSLWETAELWNGVKSRNSINLGRERVYYTATDFPSMALDLSTAEVYQQASVIGQDIEKIIERYGHEAVLDLMPRVVQVLEELELLVCEREKEKLEIAELKMENERLYFEIKREACQRRKLDEVRSVERQRFLLNAHLISTTIRYIIALVVYTTQ